MPPSRATVYNRRNDVARLQELAPVGLHVAYEDAHGFVVSRADDGTPLHTGRYQVVYAFLSGYAAGAAAAPQVLDPAEVARQLQALRVALSQVQGALDTALDTALDPPTRSAAGEAVREAPPPSLEGCRCVCHDYPEHGKLQDALEALKWHQAELLKIAAPPPPPHDTEGELAPILSGRNQRDVTIQVAPPQSEQGEGTHACICGRYPHTAACVDWTVAPPSEPTLPTKQQTCRHQYWDLGYCIDCGIYSNNPLYARQLRERVAVAAPPPSEPDDPPAS
jgi:hypothetical protein